MPTTSGSSLSNPGDRSGRGLVGTLGLAAVAVVLLTAVAFRAVALDRWPGVNGDEAYYPVTAMNIRDGHPQVFTTGSGLPLNPLYAVPVYLLHAAHPTPSFVLVRLPALLSGLLTLLLAYPLLARTTNRATACYATLLLASLPAAIAYSRFGWDQSQAALVSLVCLYASLRRSVAGLAASYLMALWVHPLNAFLAPVLMGPAAARELIAWSGVPRVDRGRHVRALLLWLVAAVALAGAAMLLIRHVLGGRVPQTLAGIAGRLIDLPGWLRFATLAGDLIGGATIYRYLAGEPPTGWLIFERAVVWSLVLVLGLRVVPLWWHRKDALGLGLAGGLITSLVAFYLLFGTAGLTPGYERYAMWMVAPAAVVAALLLAGLGNGPAARTRQLAGLLVVCGVLLTGFCINYFHVLSTTGGSAARAFRTGRIEPKQAAFEAIVMTARDDTAVTVLTEDWWSFFPIRYLASERADMEVALRGRTDQGEANLGAPRRLFAVGFAGGPFDRWIAANARNWPRQSMNDPAGQPVLYVWDLGRRSDDAARLLAEVAGDPAY